MQTMPNTAEKTGEYPARERLASGRAVGFWDKQIAYKIAGAPRFTRTAGEILGASVSFECLSLLGIVSFVISANLLVAIVFFGLPPISIPLVFATLYAILFVQNAAFVLTLILLSRVQEPGDRLYLSSRAIFAVALTVLAAFVCMVTGINPIISLGMDQPVKVLIGIGALLAVIAFSDGLNLIIFNHFLPAPQFWKSDKIGTSQPSVSSRVWSFGEPKPSPLVSIGTLALAPNELVSLSAKGNYLVVRTQSEQRVVRTPLYSVLENMPEHLGVLIHRSHWISFRAIKSVDRYRNRLRVTLNDDATFTVPSARTPQVIDALHRAGVLAEERVNCALVR